MTLDVKQPAAQEILARMLKKTDVLVQNLAPGAAARLGLGPEVLRECFPKLILCDISGYGEGGPYGNKKAYDLLIQAEVGLLSVTGTREKPSRSGISVADIAAGVYAFCNIPAALLHREKTGKGCQIDISLMESLCEWMGYPLYYSFDGEPPPERTGAFHSSVFPYGPFMAGDGTEVFFGLQNEREWVTFCREVLENSELSIDGRFCTNSLRSENRAALTEIILAVFAKLTGAQVLDRLERAHIANARMNQMADVWAHPQLKARDRWRTVVTPAGPIPALLPPGKSDAFEARMDPMPALGEHTDSVLAELGYSADEIARLRSQGVV